MPCYSVVRLQCFYFGVANIRWRFLLLCITLLLVHVCRLLILFGESVYHFSHLISSFFLFCTDLPKSQKIQNGGASYGINSNIFL